MMSCYVIYDVIMKFECCILFSFRFSVFVLLLECRGIGGVL